MPVSTDTHQRFEEALDRLMVQVREDTHILAAILCGSLSYDRVWEGSDIDLILICTDDRKTKDHNVSLVENDVNIHASVRTRSSFRKWIEGAAANSFTHSLIAKGRLLFSEDPSIDALLKRVRALGKRDTKRQLLEAGAWVNYAYNKAQKFFQTRDDLTYTSLFVLDAAAGLARIEVGLAGELIDREVLPRAAELNPEVFDVVYTNLLNRKKSRKAIADALRTIQDYMREHLLDCFRLVLEYLDEEGEVRSASEIDHYFRRNYDIDMVVSACEWLADVGAIEKASTPVKLTTRSQLEVPELAFLYVGEPLG